MKKKIKNDSVKEYSKLVMAAVEKGVPFGDIIAETTHYHGEAFAQEVFANICRKL